MSKLVLQLCYPVGSYFINDNEAFNTVEKVRAYMGFGTWVKLEDGRFIESGSSIEEKKAGIPNIMGRFSAKTYQDAQDSNGAMNVMWYDIHVTPSGINKDKNIWHRFNAAEGECGTFTDVNQVTSTTFNVPITPEDQKVYGRSATVQPKSRTAYIYYRTA